jgi:hypothetical protein
MRNEHNSDLVANTKDDIRPELLRTGEVIPYSNKKQIVTKYEKNNFCILYACYFSNYLCAKQHTKCYKR